MPKSDMVPWSEFERWAAPALLLAALAATGSEVAHHLEVAGILTTPVWITAGLTYLTYGAAMVGLLGIHRRVVDGAPRLAGAGVVATGVVVLSIAAATAGRLLLGPEGPLVVMVVVSILFYASTMFAFLLYGLACWRTPSVAQPLGVLLLAVALARVLVFAGGVLGATWLMEVGAILFILPLATAGYLVHRMVGRTDAEHRHATRVAD